MRNPGYVHEIAWNVLSGRTGRVEATELLKRNNGSDAGLDDALTALTGLTDESASKEIRILYIRDGVERGYATADTTESVWVLGQRAHAHYDLT